MYSNKPSSYVIVFSRGLAGLRRATLYPAQRPQNQAKVFSGSWSEAEALTIVIFVGVGFGCRESTTCIALVEAFGADAEDAGRDCVGHCAIEVDVVDASRERVEGRCE